MSQQLTDPPAAAGRMLLGDEAVALAAIHAGISSAYAYPGTPSTEIFQYLLDHAANDELIHANWSANEKTSVEQALGASMMNRRSIVTMKHVGLNVAADPFMNAAIVSIQGGLVIAVADDPGMHSSQNEQDSRYFADFARVICLEPSTQQECYDMTREAFDLSERFQIPVVIRLVTRLCHSRAAVQVGERRPPNPFKKAADPGSWILLPANARRLWRQHLDKLEEFSAWSEQSQWNALTPSDDNRGLGVITTGLAHNYYLENLSELDYRPAHLHIGAYPFPEDKVRELASQVDRLLIIEEGYPFVERFIRGVLSTPVEILGKESGELPLDGELNPDNVRAALGLPVREAVTVPGMTLPGRPPQLCQGCPHRDSYQAIRGALEPFECSGVMSDIGCYTLGALPPFQTIESCVCMGASIGMAKGAADAGLHPVLAVIGDSTFLHSGVTPLMDAIAGNTNMTVMILDNEAVAMTGAQPTLLPESRLEGVVRGLGIDPEHFHHVEAHPKKVGELTELIHSEAAYQGLSVILVVRRCIVAIARDKKVEARS